MPDGSLSLHNFADVIFLGGDGTRRDVDIWRSEGVFKRGDRGSKWIDVLDGEPGWKNDFAAEWLAMMSAKQGDFRPRECEAMGVLARGARETWKNFQQLGRIMQKRGARSRLGSGVSWITHAVSPSEDLPPRV